MATIKEVLAKVAVGEALSADEQAFVKGYDPDKVSNDAAAAARRKAEQAAADAKAEADALKAEKAEREARAADEAAKGQTEAQRNAKALSDVQKELADIKRAKADSDARASAMERKQTLAQIRQANGIQFTDKVSQRVAVGAFEETFGDLQDLSDPAVVAERVAKFKTENPALVVDTSGHGTGDAAKGGGAGQKKEKTIEERRAELQAKKVI